MPQWSSRMGLTSFYFKVAHALGHHSPHVRGAQDGKQEFSVQLRQGLSTNTPRMLVSSNGWGRRRDKRMWPLHTMPSVHAQSCLTLQDFMDGSLPGSSVHGISQARILEWVAIFYSRRSSQPRDQTHIYVSCIGRSPLHHLGSPKNVTRAVWSTSREQE